MLKGTFFVEGKGLDFVGGPESLSCQIQTLQLADPFAAQTALNKSTMPSAGCAETSKEAKGRPHEIESMRDLLRFQVKWAAAAQDW